MKAKVKNLEVSARYVGGKFAPWKNGNSNYHIITVKNIDTGKSAKFDFWESSMTVRTERREDIKNALNCILQDALYGNGSLDLAGFCEELGYCITDIAEAIRSFKSCKMSYKKMTRLGYGTGKIIDTLNELNGN